MVNVCWVASVFKYNVEGFFHVCLVKSNEHQLHTIFNLFLFSFISVKAAEDMMVDKSMIKSVIMTRFCVLIYFLKLCLIQVLCFIDFPILKSLQSKNMASIKLYNFRLGSLV